MLSALALASSLLVTQTPASPPPPADEKLPFVTTIHIENDVFAGSDRYYTNGLRVEHYGEYDGCYSLAHALGFPNGLDHRYLCGGSLAQNLYTPSHITPNPEDTVWPDPKDRPYGAWLHAGLLFQHLTAAADPSNSSRLTVEATVGVTGPASGGAFVQRTWHAALREVFHSDKPRAPIGWEAQLPTEPTLHLSALREQPLLWSRYADATWSVGAMLGTVFTNVSLGGTVRVGWLARPFGLSPIMPSIRAAQVRAQGESTERVQQVREETETAERTWEAYLFARGQARFVARNLFLDGTLFRDSISVRKAPFVGDSEVGAAVRTRCFQLDLSMVFRTQELAESPDAQRNGHRFMQIQLSFLH